MMIDPGHSKISIERQCQLVGLSRSSSYYQGKGTASAEAEDEYNLFLMRLIDEQYTRQRRDRRCPILGVRRMNAGPRRSRTIYAAWAT
jgi:putative transposase